MIEQVSSPMQRLTVMLSSQDRLHHHSIAIDLLSRAKQANLAGATMLQAFEGQGRSGILHRRHLFTDDVPLSILIIDTDVKITALLDEIRDVLGDALVVITNIMAMRA